MSYTAGSPQNWIELGNELRRLQQALEEERDVVRFTVLYAAPNKPRAGAVYYADGTTWNPGSGAGLYRYSGSAYVHLG